MNNLFLIRGLPGSGKSHLAQAINRVKLSACHYEADQFMVDVEGNYTFDPLRLRDCHQACQDATKQAMKRLARCIVVSNTFSQRWEMDYYHCLAKKYGYTVFEIDLFDAGLTDSQLAVRNQHACPIEKIAAMRARWEK
jgi:predicted kinase